MTQLTSDTTESTTDMCPVTVTAGSPSTDALGTESHERVIDENTDWSTLTDQEIMRLTQGIKDDAVVSRPLVSTPVPITVLREEYQGSVSTVQHKIDWLEKMGWNMVWRARGDGDCFYRSFTLAYLLRILHSPNPPLSANLAFSNIQAAMPLLQQVNFDMELVNDFIEPLLDQLKKLAPETEEGKLPTEWEIVQDLQDPETSNAIVCALRLLTSAYIRSNPNTFSPFLLHPETLLPLPIDQFCLSEVEPCAREADQVQIMALARCLKQGIRVCYLDGSEVRDGEANFVELEIGDGEGLGEDPITLLYRPGHYDVLDKDRPPTEEQLKV